MNIVAKTIFAAAVFAATSSTAFADAKDVAATPSGANSSKDYAAMAACLKAKGYKEAANRAECANAKPNERHFGKNGEALASCNWVANDATYKKDHDSCL